MSGIMNDQRHEYLIGTAKSMLSRQMPPHQILATLEQENKSYCNPPLDRLALINLIQDTQRNIGKEDAKAEEASKKK